MEGKHTGDLEESGGVHFPKDKAVSRREFLKLAGVAGAAVGLSAGLGGILAACGGDEETTTTTAAGATTTAAGDATTTTAGGASTTVSASKPTPVLIHATTSLQSEFPQLWEEGSKKRAAELGIEYVATFCNFDPTKQLDDINSMIAKYGPAGLFSILTTDASVPTGIIPKFEEVGIYYCIHSNPSKDMPPWNYNGYITAMEPSSESGSYGMARDVLEQLGGQGKVCNIGGDPGFAAARERDSGVMLALEEFPDVELLESQAAAGWDPAKAQEIAEAWLTKYPQIDAFFTANDDIATGPINAMRAQRPEALGKTFVTGWDAFNSGMGNMAAGYQYETAWQPASWIGYSHASMLYDAYMGTLDFQSLPQEKRAFRIQCPIVKADQVEEFSKQYVEVVPDYDPTDYFTYWAGPLETVIDVPDYDPKALVAYLEM